MAKEYWIANALNPSHKGFLRKSLGIKEGENIPEKKLKIAAEKPGIIGKRARLAETLKSFRK